METAPAEKNKRSLLMAKAKHVEGFKENAAKIAKKQGIPMKNAKAILAAGARKAGKAAVRKNPDLKKVKGK